MNYRQAQLWGGALAVTVVGVVVLISRAMPPPCLGAATISFRPPLLGPAIYEISLDLDQRRPCTFRVELGQRAEVREQACSAKWQLQVRGRAGQPAITGVVVSAAPEMMHLRVTRGGERIYDTSVKPQYLEANPGERGEVQEYCGQSTFLKPECIRGSSQCKPFGVICDGPEDCPGGQACCAAPDWGMEYGAANSMECTTRSACLSRIESFVVCHDDADCPKQMRCSDDSLSEEYERKLRACAPH